MRLALDFPSWVERRVLHVDHIDTQTTRWRTGVMFRWPPRTDFAPSARPWRGETVYVPLDLLAKGPLAGLDGMRPDGSPVPYLPYARSARLAYLGVASILTSLAKESEREELEGDIRKTVRTITEASPAVALDLFEAATGPGGKLSEFVPAGHPVHGLLRELATGLMLLVPARYEPEDEAVYRYVYLSVGVYRRVEPTKADHVSVPLRQRAWDRFRFRDVYVRDEVLPFGWANSFHFEVNPPEEVQIPRARLVGSYRREDTPPDGPRLVVPVADAPGGPTLDLHAKRPSRAELGAVVPALPPAPPDAPPAQTEAARLSEATRVRPSRPARDDYGIAEVSFRLKPGGTFLVATIVAVLTTALLILSAFRLPEMEGSTGTAVLLAFPGLTLGYLTKPGEHIFATRLLVGVRSAAGIVGLCAFGMAWILAGGFVEHVPPGSGLSCASKVGDVQVHPAPHHTWTSTADPDDPELSCRTTSSTPAETRLTPFAEDASVAAAVIAFAATLWLLWGFRRTIRGHDDLPPPPSKLESPDDDLEFG